MKYSFNVQYSLQSFPSSSSVAALGFAAVGTLVGTINSIYSGLEEVNKTTSNCESTISNAPIEIPEVDRLPVDLSDRLARKPYLQWPGSDRSPGIPETIRLLTIDLPSLRDGGISKPCHLALHRQFADGVALPMRISYSAAQQEERSVDKGETICDSQPKNKSKHMRRKADTSLEVEQKALVRALYQCGKDDGHVGVEIMEASVFELNPLNLRRMHSFGALQYLATSRRSSNGSNNDTPYSQSGSEIRAPMEVRNVDELTAPWNQLAWAEELALRISGKVVFGEPMKRAGRWRRFYDGTSFYQRTVPSSRFNFVGSWIPFWDHGGVDGKGNNWASNKPHAVVANGAALQRFPQSLRLLHMLCKEHNVPLYIIYSPRKWGGNTHDTIGDVVRDLRQQLKQNIATAAMQYAAGCPFARGRLVGRLETEVKWQLREALRHSREVVETVKARRKEEKERDWSKLSANELEQKLSFHKVIQDKDDSASNGKVYSEALLSLANACLGEEYREIYDDDSAAECE